MTPENEGASAPENEGSVSGAPFEPLTEEFVRLLREGWPALLIVAPRGAEDQGVVLGNVRSGQELLLLLHQAFIWARGVAEQNGDKELSRELEPFITDLKYLAPATQSVEKRLGEMVPSLRDEKRDN